MTKEQLRWPVTVAAYAVLVVVAVFAALHKISGIWPLVAFLGVMVATITLWRRPRTRERQDR